MLYDNPTDGSGLCPGEAMMASPVQNTGDYPDEGDARLHRTTAADRRVQVSEFCVDIRPRF